MNRKVNIGWRSLFGRVLPLATFLIGGPFWTASSSLSIMWTFVAIAGVLQFLGTRLIMRAFRKLLPDIKAKKFGQSKDAKVLAWLGFFGYIVGGLVMIGATLYDGVLQTVLNIVGKFHAVSTVNVADWHRCSLLALVLVLSTVGVVWHHPIQVTKPSMPSLRRRSPRTLVSAPPPRQPAPVRPFSSPPNPLDSLFTPDPQREHAHNGAGHHPE